MCPLFGGFIVDPLNSLPHTKQPPAQHSDDHYYSLLKVIEHSGNTLTPSFLPLNDTSNDTISEGRARGEPGNKDRDSEKLPCKILDVISEIYSDNFQHSNFYGL